MYFVLSTYVIVMWENHMKPTTYCVRGQKDKWKENLPALVVTQTKRYFHLFFTYIFALIIKSFGQLCCRYIIVLGYQMSKNIPKYACFMFNFRFTL